MKRNYRLLRLQILLVRYIWVKTCLGVFGVSWPCGRMVRGPGGLAGRSWVHVFVLAFIFIKVGEREWASVALSARERERETDYEV